MKIKQTVLTLLTLVLAGCSTITPTSTPANSPNVSIGRLFYHYTNINAS